jgi:hypothetical protein
MFEGNLSHSMRANYSFGVDKYYEAVALTVKMHAAISSKD